ncbi:hypothetical protein ACJW30_11G147000 [Castanea mollissima]
MPIIPLISLFCPLPAASSLFVMGKNTTSNSEAKKVGALWGDPSWITTFCNLCVEEIEAGNRRIFAALSAKG